MTPTSTVSATNLIIGANTAHLATTAFVILDSTILPSATWTIADSNDFVILD